MLSTSALTNPSRNQVCWPNQYFRVVMVKPTRRIFKEARSQASTDRQLIQ